MCALERYHYPNTIIFKFTELSTYHKVHPHHIGLRSIGKAHLRDSDHAENEGYHSQAKDYELWPAENIDDLSLGIHD